MDRLFVTTQVFRLKPEGNQLASLPAQALSPRVIQSIHLSNYKRFKLDLLDGQETSVQRNALNRKMKNMLAIS